MAPVPALYDSDNWLLRLMYAESLKPYIWEESKLLSRLLVKETHYVVQRFLIKRVRPDWTHGELTFVVLNRENRLDIRKLALSRVISISDILHREAALNRIVRWGNRDDLMTTAKKILCAESATYRDEITAGVVRPHFGIPREDALRIHKERKWRY